MVRRTTSNSEVSKGTVPSAAEPEAGDAPNEGSRKRKQVPLPKEIGGQEGPEPTRYGDWEKNGRCTDF